MIRRNGNRHHPSRRPGFPARRAGAGRQPASSLLRTENTRSNDARPPRGRRSGRAFLYGLRRLRTGPARPWDP
ncbi:hypothetical protein DVDV_3077 [Desulfovibrio sp. DV]|nr:hypothetical protein DVDV_3077 [Desulfovibrio sp. DV]